MNNTNKVYVVYSTNGYTCSEPLKVFLHKKEAEKYAEEEVCSGIKELELIGKD